MITGMTEPPTLTCSESFSPSSTFDLLVWCVGPLGTAMRVSECFMQSYMHMRCQARQLDSYSTARHCSTARQLDSSTAQQTSTDLSTDLDAQAHGVRLDRLHKNSTVTRQARQARPRQHLDSASTAPRQRLDGASTARQLDSQGSTADENSCGAE
jgi:hypothetical protein